MPESSVPSYQKLIIEVNKGSELAASAGKMLKLISGSEAFRRYDWLHNLPTYNVSGNLRGMVTSPGWRAVFDATSETLEVVEKVALIAGFAANIAEQSSNIGSILHSSEPAYMKGLRLATVAGTAAERTLLSPVSSGTSVVFHSLQGYCEMIGLAGGSAQSFSTACVSNLEKANNSVQSTFKIVTDTNRQGEAVYWVITKITSLRFH